MSNIRNKGYLSYAAFFLVILGALLFIASCGGHDPGRNMPPRYPNSQYLQDDSGRKETAGTMVYWSSFTTVDPWKDVLKFYKEKLDSRPGWTANEGTEYCCWTNGNISADCNNMATDPQDPGKAGGYVSLFKGEGRTFIYLIWSDPN